MKKIYEPILAQLKTKVPELRWIDLDTNQLGSSTRPGVAFPCALIGIELSNCTTLSDIDQQAEAVITISLAFDTVGATNSEAPTMVRSDSLEVYDIIEKVHVALQGFETVSFEPLTRKRQGKQQNRHNLFVYSITYNTNTE